MRVYKKTTNKISFYKENAVKWELVTYFGKCESIDGVIRGEFTFFSSELFSPFIKIFNSPQ